jgi:hypothetical protein
MTQYINTSADLYALMTTSDIAVLAKSYIQTANIDMTGFISESIVHEVGLQPYDFAGVYDGQGYTITIGSVVSSFTGLFDSLAKPNAPAIGGIVKNINLIYNNITNNVTNYWGGLVGAMAICSILNCSVTYNGITNITTTDPAITIGLVCGFMGQGSTITNTNLIINNSVTISGGDNNVIGLLCGLSSSSYITGCSITSTGTFNISLTVTDNITSGDYSTIGMLTGTSNTSITRVISPLLLNNTVNLNNNGTITLANLGSGTTYTGAISGTLDGDSYLGTTDVQTCIININNNQTLVGGFNDFFGQTTDNPQIIGCQFNYITTTNNTSRPLTISPTPPVASVIYINSYDGSYILSSGNYYIPGTTASLITSSHPTSLQSQTGGTAGIIINGTLYSVGSSYLFSNSTYQYTILVKGVGSMYFGFEVSQIPQIIPTDCICQVNNYSVNPQTGITVDSRITNMREDKVIRINVDNEIANNSVIYPKFKSYSDYMKYLQAGLKYR